MVSVQAVARTLVTDHGDHVHCVFSDGMPPGCTYAALDRLMRLQNKRIRAGSLVPFRVLFEARNLRQIPPDLVPTLVVRQAELSGRVIAFAGFKGPLASTLRALESARHSDVRFFDDAAEARAWLLSRERRRGLP